MGSGDDELSDGGADVSSGLSDSVGGSDWLGDSDSESVGDVDGLGDSLVERDGDLLGERVGLGSDAEIDPLGEGRSTDPSSPHEVRSMTSSSPAKGVAAARLRLVRMVIMIAVAFLRHDVADTLVGLARRAMGLAVLGRLVWLSVLDLFGAVVSLRRRSPAGWRVLLR